ncbi:MAG: EAL domain-containing protein [bacterium]|nr:EAL domain-containing protein [bacterium]
MRPLGSIRFIATLAIVAVLVAEAAFTIALGANGLALNGQMRQRAATAARYRQLDAILATERIGERSEATALFRSRVAALRPALTPARAAELDLAARAHDRYAALASRAGASDARALDAAYGEAVTALRAAIASYDRHTQLLDDQGLARAAALQRSAAIASVVGIAATLALLALVERYKRKADDEFTLRLHALELSVRTDPLTGLANARAFHEALAQAAARTHAIDAPARLLLVDIDDFKAANDARGEAAGDALLTALADLLVAAFPHGSLFRLQADRFAVLGPPDRRNGSVLDAHEIVERASVALGGLTVSAGYAQMHAGRDDEDLLERAQAALHAAKHEGGHRLVRYDEVRDRVFVYSTAQARQVRRLINERAIDIHVQPIVETESGRIIAYEALARAPERFGLHKPQDIFDIAERLHRSFELDRICVAAALRFAAAHRPEALLFINAAPASLEADRLDVVRCFRDIRTLGIDPRRIVIELTERKIANTRALASRIAQIQEWGMRVALDDTGAGHAGLDVLSAMTFDFVKIDRSLMVRAMTDERARSVLIGLIAIAHGAGSTVIAEGIETDEMLAFARGLQARVPNGTIAACQGFALAHPQPEFVRQIPLR